jgi:hypothetical protein
MGPDDKQKTLEAHTWHSGVETFCEEALATLHFEVSTDEAQHSSCHQPDEPNGYSFE